MSSVNKVILIGHVGKDPEIHGSVTNFSIATSMKGKDGVEHTEWHKCASFNRAAEVAAQYLKKGSQVFIEGSLRTRKWQDKDRTDRYTTEVIVGRLTMLGKRDEHPKSKSSRDMTDYEDDIPF